jgi:hypothetical protein
LATIFFITKECKHEKGNYWGLVEFGSDYGLGIVYDSHHHVWWANRHLHNLLLWQQLHNKLFLRENTYLTAGFFMVYIPFVKAIAPHRRNMRPFTHAFTRKGQWGNHWSAVVSGLLRS